MKTVAGQISHSWGKLMSNARAILDERLARGEISEDDHDRLTERLTKTTAAVAEHAPTPATQAISAPSSAGGLSKAGAGAWMGIPAAIFFVMMMFKPDNIGRLNELGLLMFGLMGLAFVFGLVKAAFGR